MTRTVLITGASSGIGKAAALKFAEEGWNVVATMRSPEKEAELTQLDNVLVTKLDVQQTDTITSAIQRGIDRFGQINAVVNNAGYGQYGLFEALQPEQIQRQFDVNVFGVMNVIRVILPHFRQQKAGMILNISSGAGRFTLPMLSMYSASKFALEGFSEALSYELSALNISVKIIEPGGTHTNFNSVTGEQFAHDPALTDYTAFTEAAGQLFASMVAQQLATGEEVANTIFQAATDGTDTLRYVIGNENFMKRIANRQQMSDQDYVHSVREAFERFLPHHSC